MNPFSSLVMAVSVVALLTFVVGVRMYLLRVREMKARRRRGSAIWEPARISSV